MKAYYNENDKFAAQWLRNLSFDDEIAFGHIDDRDIMDVVPDDLRGFSQVHLFAGIGLWSLALRYAGWPDDRPVWTCSRPCQPFSQAGQGKGFADERHLWPAAHWLINQHRPYVIFGEQVASTDGRAWLDLVSTDLEAIGYAVGAGVIPSAGIGAPNIRHRLYWVAHTNSEENGWRRNARSGQGSGARPRQSQQRFAGLRSAMRRVGDTSESRLSDSKPQDVARSRAGRQGRTTPKPSCPPDPWRSLEWVDCTDGKRRPFESGSFPLAARCAGDLGKIRAYGNAINPILAAEFISAFMHVESVYDL